MLCWCTDARLVMVTRSSHGNFPLPALQSVLKTCSNSNGFTPSKLIVVLLCWLRLTVRTIEWCLLSHLQPSEYFRQFPDKYLILIFPRDRHHLITSTRANISLSLTEWSRQTQYDNYDKTGTYQSQSREIDIRNGWWWEPTRQYHYLGSELVKT